MKIAFAGYYGMENFGDDLFAVACLQEAGQWSSHNRLRIVSKPIDGVAAHYSCPRVLARFYDRHGKLGSTVRLATHSAERLLNDLFVHGGGSLFKRVPPSRAFGARLSLIRRSKQAAIGVSLGPFATVKDEQAVTHHLRGFEYLSVRDRPSYEWAIAQQFDFPVEMCGDLVGVLPFKRRPAGERAVIGVSLAQFAGFRVGDGSAASRFYEQLVVAIADHAAAIDATVRILDLNGHRSVGDGHLSQYLEGLLRARQIPAEVLSRRSLPSTTLAEAIGECDAIISARLHGAIVAYLSSVPFALVEYEQKCSDFLDDIGQPESLRFDGFDSNSASVTAILQRLLNGGERAQMQPAAYRERSRRHFLSAPWARSATESR